MASIQKKGESYYCQFLHGRKRHTVTIGKVSESNAQAFAARTEELLGLLARGRLSLPEGVAISEFVLADGRVVAAKPPAEATQPQKPLGLRSFRERYLEAHGGGAMESNSLATIGMHLRHFARTLGDTFELQGLTHADLQRHVTERRKKVYRGRPLSPATLRKEVASLRAAWNWAEVAGLVEGVFPGKGLVYPKSDEKPPFMTRDEIERRIKGGGLGEREVADLWELPVPAQRGDTMSAGAHRKPGRSAVALLVRRHCGIYRRQTQRTLADARRGRGP